jgi:formamidopyrimidine-DNA glycosylase
MPELPDVEYFKYYFKKTSLHKKVENITCQAKELIQDISFQEFQNKLTENQFQDASRRGKFLIIKLTELEEKLLIHFAMTGSLNYTEQNTEKSGEDRFTRLTFQFDNGYELRWRNMRKLGKIYLVSDIEKIDLINEMGPEPLELSFHEFSSLIEQHSRQMLKSFFMGQSNIAGIGNVYSDEILFQAGLYPRKKISDLKRPEKERLYQKMQEVLKKGFEIRKKDDHFKEDEWLIPHRDEINNCPNDKNHQLESKKVSGRTTIFCPRCQPE